MLALSVRLNFDRLSCRAHAEVLSKVTGLDTHVPLRSTAEGKGLLPLLPFG